MLVTLIQPSASFSRSALHVTNVLVCVASSLRVGAAHVAYRGAVRIIREGIEGRQFPVGVSDRLHETTLAALRRPPPTLTRAPNSHSSQNYASFVTRILALIPKFKAVKHVRLL